MIDGIKLVRVDFRLVHEQVITKWSNTISAKEIEVLKGVRRWNGCPYVLPNPTTLKPYGNLFCAWDTARKRAGLPDVRMHDLRHSFAVASIESGDDIKTVQSNLGHATASFTLDVYGHVSQKMRQQSADRMEEFIQKVSG